MRCPTPRIPSLPLCGLSASTPRRGAAGCRRWRAGSGRPRRTCDDVVQSGRLTHPHDVDAQSPAHVALHAARVGVRPRALHRDEPALRLELLADPDEGLEHVVRTDLDGRSATTPSPPGTRPRGRAPSTTSGSPPVAARRPAPGAPARCRSAPRGRAGAAPGRLWILAYVPDARTRSSSATGRRQVDELRDRRRRRRRRRLAGVEDGEQQVFGAEVAVPAASGLRLGLPEQGAVVRRRLQRCVVGRHGLHRGPDRHPGQAPRVILEIVSVATPPVVRP